MPAAKKQIHPQKVVTVENLIAALERQNPKAVVLWNGNGSCAAHAIDGTMRAGTARDVGNGIYSLIGGARNVPVVLIDILDAP